MEQNEEVKENEDKFESFEDKLSKAYEILSKRIERKESLSESQATIFENFCNYASKYFSAKQKQEFPSEQEREPIQVVEEEKHAITYDWIRNRFALGETISTEERLFMRLYCAEHGIDITELQLDKRKKSDEGLDR